MFTDPFMQRALLAALVLAPLCALLGVFVIARRMAFFSDTVSHSALAGVALGFWWGFAEPTVPMVLFSLLVAAAMLWLKENTELLTDAIMALLLSGSVALGVIILSLLKGNYRGELDRYLFGDITAVNWRDVLLGAALLAVVGTSVFAGLSSLTLLSAQEDLAHVCGVPVKRLNYLFILALTLTVAMSIRLLGIILVTSLLVIPPSAARGVSRNLRQHIILSVLIGLLGGVGGTIFSYQFDVPCGSSIVMACVVLFLACLVLGRIRSQRPAKPIGL